MTDTTTYQQWIGRKVVDQDGSKIGRVDEVYLDEATGQPEWITVHTGLFGTRTSFVPLEGAQMTGDDVRVPYSKQEVKDAPNMDPGGRLDPAEEQRLFQHYSMSWDNPTYAGDGRTDARRDMTRSEEELRVGKESVERGRARLRKYVVTEDVETTVPLQHEEVRVEREPITARDRDAARRGGRISDDQQEVVLHEERPVVQKEVVPKERVRLGTESVTEQRRVADQLRKERIDFDRDPRRRR